MRCLAPAVAVMLAVVAAPRAQSTSPGGPLVVTGRVVADEGGEAVPNARVTTNPATNSESVVLANSEGWFTLTASTRPQRAYLSDLERGRGQVTRHIATFRCRSSRALV
jgi:hypothetical protein